MRHDKSAVFQINDPEGVVRLICVRSATFGDGARLEAFLRGSLGTCLHVTFLGRYDRVDTVNDLAEFLDLAFQPARASMLLTDFRAKHVSAPDHPH
jgi:hypothetical protein